MPTDEEKRALAMESMWPIETAAELFDIPLEDVRRLLGAVGAVQVDRFQLEKRLAQEGRVGLDWLSLEFGVPRDALEVAMQKPPPGIAPFPLAAYGDGERFLLPHRLAEAWVKEVLPKHKTWSTLDSRARDLADRLDGRVRECAVSKRFHDSPPAVATCRCIITWDDVSRAHQEYVDNRKPLSLEPDHVGWHAIFEKKIDTSALWRADLGNLQRYLEEHRITWQAA